MNFTNLELSNFISTIIVAVAALYLIRKLASSIYKTVRNKGATSGCDSCCSQDKQHLPSHIKRALKNKISNSNS